MDPQRKLVVVVDGGPRPWVLAPRGLPQRVRGLAPGWVPLCVTDGCKESKTAIRSQCGPWRHPPRRRANGPRPKPRWRPRPARRSAHVVQS
jgi:hypothetical protein